MISVVNPALNEAGNIAAAIASAKVGTTEAIVVDGGSSDDTATVAEAAGALVRTTHANRACQMNAGARFASGDVLLFLHADTNLPADYGAAVERALYSRGVAAGAFSFGIDGFGLKHRIVKAVVALRCRLRPLPYGCPQLLHHCCLSCHSPSLGGYIYTEYFQTPDQRKNFDIHYLAFYAYGWISDKIFYFGEFELEHGGTGGSNTFVEQAYLDYWFVPNVAVKIGAILTPYNRFDEFHDPLSNFLVTRPQVSREIGVSAWKDVGVDLHGYFNIAPTSSVGFDAYVINGLGDGSRLRGSRQYRDNNENLAVGAHVLLNTPVADLYGEYSNGTSENAPGTADGDMSGFFIQASRLFQSKYRATVRYGDLDYLDTRTLADGPATTDRDMSELVFGFTYYPTSKVAFKLEYNFFMEGDRATPASNNQLGIQAAVKF